MSFKKQLERQFAEQRRGWAKKNALKKQLYPYSLKHFRMIMDAPASVKHDHEKWMAWIKKNKSRRVQTYLAYMSRHWWGVG